MIVPTLDAMVYESERGQWFDPYQGGDDEFMCLCDDRVCRCAAPMNGIVVTVKQFVDHAPDTYADDADGLDSLPF